jgi:hypothetical protein
MGPRLVPVDLKTVERKIFWITFTLLGLVADFRAATPVGTGSNHSHLLRELVGGISERLVLA